MTVLRWFARIIGTIPLLLLLVVFAMGFFSLFNPTATSIKEILLCVADVTMIVGLIIAWKWELLGGLLIFGGIFLVIVNCVVPRGVFWGLLLAAGLIHFGCGLRTAIKRETG
jgi:hypothetical protein